MKYLPRGKGRSPASISVPSRVAEAIQEMIAERHLKPGDALPSQRELAKRLGVSRPSLREGLSMLETLGVLRVEDRRGLFVAETGAGPVRVTGLAGSYSLEEIYGFRLSLEPAALSLATGALSGADISEMRHLTNRMLEGALKNRPVVAGECDTHFHDLIFDRCSNRIYRDVHRQFARELRESQWAPMVVLDQVRDTAREHHAIVDALEKGNSKTACERLENHIRLSARRVNIQI